MTARGDGRMERASHGAEGLRFALLCFCGEWSQPLVGVEEVNGCGKGIGLGVGLGAAGSGGLACSSTTPADYSRSM